MDFSAIISSLQLAVALFQLRLDHYTEIESPDNNESEEFNKLGEAIRSLEYALLETVAHIGTINEPRANQRLSQLWQEASELLREIDGSDEIAHITYQKGLYWVNPNFFNGMGTDGLKLISLENVLKQIAPLRKKHANKLKKKRNQRANP